LTTFLSRYVSTTKLVVSERTFTRQNSQNSVVKIWQLIGGGRRRGPPMVQLAQWLIRPCYVKILMKLRSSRCVFALSSCYGKYRVHESESV